MKYLIYTDLHASYTSSILPLYMDNNKYTTRLQMIVDTGKWIKQVADDNQVDMIVNGGDTFDSHIVKSEELTAVTEFMSYLKDYQHSIIVGNHDTVKDRSAFHAVTFLSQFPNVTVYETPTKINNELSVLPYMPAEDITIDILESIKNSILVSHIDILGSKVSEFFELTAGVQPEMLENYFDIVLNGHIHAHEQLSEKVQNVGGCSSCSFSDANAYKPWVTIYDSETKELTRVNNPYSILFRKVNCKSKADALSWLSEHANQRYAVTMTVPVKNRNSILEAIQKTDNVVAYRLKNATISASKKKNTEHHVDTLFDINQEFNRFVEGSSELKYPLQRYKKVVSLLCN